VIGHNVYVSDKSNIGYHSPKHKVN